MKRLLGSDKQACNNIIRELNIHKQLSGHPNIVKYVAASFIDRTAAKGNAEYLLVSELCKGGSLIDCLGSAIEPDTVLKLIYQAAKAVGHMHAQTPSITHRDIKIENFLIGIDGLLKLCDFGSATTDLYQPDISWSAQQRDTLEDQLASITTPMYRCPEQLDLWTNYPIGTKCDIWALGCVLYFICFQKHPFEDSAKLRIVNSNYILPTDSRYTCFHDVIRGCLHVDPNKRFDVPMILDRLGAISETKEWSLKGTLNLKGKPVETPPNVSPNMSPMHNAQDTQQPPSRPAPPRPAPLSNLRQPGQIRPSSGSISAAPPPPPTLAHDSYSSGASGSSLFSSLKGGAGSLFKNIKDTSSKVIHTVQQSIARTDIDISAITSRILVMPCPSEGIESAYRTNNIEDVKVYIESRYAPGKLSVYNLGPRSCPRLPPPVRVVEANFIFPLSNHAPLLQGMYSLAEDMFGFLSADPMNVIIIQSADNGRSISAVMV